MQKYRMQRSELTIYGAEYDILTVSLPLKAFSFYKRFATASLSGALMGNRSSLDFAT